MIRNRQGFSRRTLVGASVGTVAAGAVLSGGAVAQEASPAASPASGAWSFTDDKGVTVSLPAMPTRILMDVNAAAPLWDFGIKPVGLFGWNANETGDLGAAGGNVDPTGIPMVGNPTEPFQPEAAIATDPELIVTITWAPDTVDGYWSIDTAIVEQARGVAPIVAISATGAADVNTQRFAELAAALGADLSTPELAAAQEGYAAARVSLEETVASRPEISVLFTYIDGENDAYIASWPDWADLALFKTIGLNVAGPELEVGEYWEQLSNEEALKYPADVLMNSTRPGMLDAAGLTEHPTWGAHPAVAAGQVGSWNQDFIMSWQGMTAAYQTIVDMVNAAEKVTD